MTDRPVVSVIVPTLGLAARAGVIQRALESILSQQNVRVVPIVVVNGSQSDPSLIRKIQNYPGVRIIKLADQSLPLALRAGRDAVKSEWFTALDDDDVFLPGALSARVERLLERPDCDTVITNGYVCEGNKKEMLRRDMTEVENDPLSALQQGNWLLPGGWLCRTERVGSSIFDGMPRALECTFLALQFSLHCKLCVMNAPTVAWHKDTPESESKSHTYALHQVAAFKELVKLSLPPSTKARMKELLNDAQHGIADTFMREGRYGRAWQWHLKSVMGYKGWRYLPYSRRLLTLPTKRI